MTVDPKQPQCTEEGSERRGLLAGLKGTARSGEGPSPLEGDGDRRKGRGDRRALLMRGWTAPRVPGFGYNTPARSLL